MTAEQLQLITTAVDGELSADEFRTFRALLGASAEARALFDALKADSARLAALPRVAPPADLRAKILARLADATPAPRVLPKPLAEPARAPAPVRRRSVAVPVAASILFAVTAGSFAYFNRTTAGQQVAKNDWANLLPSAQDASTAVPSPTAPQFDRPDLTALAHFDVSPVPRVPNLREIPPATVATAPAPRTINPDLIGFPVLPKLPPFERVDIRLPFLRPVADLGREDIGQELLDELRREPTPFKFDLFVRDTARGVEAFQNTARASGLAVHADATTLERLKKKQVHSVVIYTESLSAQELIALFATLSAEDAKFSPRVCNSLHATAVVRADELELKAVLGHDVGLFKRPTGAGPTPRPGPGERPAPSKSVNSETIDSVVKSVSGSAAKAADKFAVLTTWQTAHASIPRTNPANAVELTQYIQKRGDRKPNAVPAIIVIRPAG